MAARNIESHWRDTARTPRFFIIDARSAFPLLFFLVHIRWWTFIVALIFTAFFALLEHYGFTAVVFLRLLRTYLSGRMKYVRPWWRAERFR